MPGQGKTELLEFLDFAGNKGLMTKTSAQSLRSACTAVFSILDDAETDDVFTMDLDALFHRYENIKGMEVSPNTMKAYRQRVKQAISDFERYKDNPSQWKPAGGQRSTSGGKRSSTNRTNDSGAPDRNGKLDSPVLEAKSADEITHQFPLRRDVIVRVSGIPFDVTRSEMARMTAYLSNLVAESDETEPPQLMPGITENDIA